MLDLFERRRDAQAAGEKFYRGEPHSCGSRIRYTKSGSCVDCTKKKSTPLGSCSEWHAKEMRERQSKMRAYHERVFDYARAKSFGWSAEPPKSPQEIFDGLVDAWVDAGEAARNLGKKASELWPAFLVWAGDNYKQELDAAIGGRNTLAARLRERGFRFASTYHGGGLAAVPAPASADDDPWGGL
jgi:hypothetical protein